MISVVLTFLATHPTILGAVVFLLVISVAAMPPPTPGVKYFRLKWIAWNVLARASLLAWDKWGGKFKVPGTLEPKLSDDFRRAVDNADPIRQLRESLAGDITMSGLSEPLLPQRLRTPSASPAPVVVPDHPPTLRDRNATPPPAPEKDS